MPSGGRMVRKICRSDYNSVGEMASEELKTSLSKASAYLDNGQYDDAFAVLDALEQQFPGLKDVSELVSVAEVCLAATKTSCTCTKPQQRKILDWYLILKVEDNAEIDVIRRRYRQLALLLHPDKNKHPKAEAAFKLVSEAYACLSDKKKRTLYNVERSKLCCKRCPQKVQNSKGNFKSSSPVEVHYGQKYPKAWRLFVEKDATFSERMSDEEKLQMFRRRARARVDSTAQAWQERRARFKEEFNVMNSAFLSSRVDREEFPTFEASDSMFPSYPHLRTPMKMKSGSDIPIFKNLEDKFFSYSQSKNSSTTEARLRCRGEKLETPIYEESMGKKVTFSVLKRNVLRKDMKEMLKDRQEFCREPSKAPRNLEGLLRNLQGESGRGAHGVLHSDFWRSKLEGNKSSINIKNRHYKRDLEASDTDEDCEEFVDLYDNTSNSTSIPHVGENQFNKVPKKNEQEESKFNPPRKESSFFPELFGRSGKDVDDLVGGENVRKSEELLKTLEHLREEAKDVAATLDELRKSVRSEEDHVVCNLFCQKFPVAAES